jgi:hypothetical protein
VGKGVVEMVTEDEMTEWKRKEGRGWGGGRKALVATEEANPVTIDRARDYRLGLFLTNEPTAESASARGCGDVAMWRSGEGKRQEDGHVLGF